MSLVFPFLLLMACHEPEPVLTVVRPAGLAEGTSSLEGTATSDERSRKTSTPYVKPENVYIDIRWLGGRSYQSVRDEVTRQLGLVMNRRDLGTRKGVELVFARGTIRVRNDTIYMIRVDLPRPVTRSEALELTGFPPYVGNWRITHREYRLGHELDFVRFRLKRAEGNSDRVIQVEAWKQESDQPGG